VGEPTGRIERATQSGAGIRVTGWAVDPQGPEPLRVEITLDEREVFTADANLDRPDLAGRTGSNTNRVGFDVTIPKASGRYRLCVDAIDQSGEQGFLGCRHVTVRNAAPFGRLDQVREIPNGVHVSGWAIDPDLNGPISVRILVDGRVHSTIRSDRPRTDVAAAHPGHGSRLGFDRNLALRAGRHEVCVEAVDSAGGNNTQLGCQTITVRNQLPFGLLDGVRRTSDGAHIWGWTVDPDRPSGAGFVHVYVDGKPRTVVPVDRARADVARFLDAPGETYGFDHRLPLAEGRHEICVYATDDGSSLTPLLGCGEVVSGNRAPYGVLDRARSTGSRQVRVSGWAIDPEGRGTVEIEISVDGRVAGSTRADRGRADVARIHTGHGNELGFDATVSTTAGRRQICVDAIDASGLRTRLGCRTIQVRA